MPVLPNLFQFTLAELQCCCCRQPRSCVSSLHIQTNPFPVRTSGVGSLKEEDLIPPASYNFTHTHTWKKYFSKYFQQKTSEDFFLQSFHLYFSEFLEYFLNFFSEFGLKKGGKCIPRFPLFFQLYSCRIKSCVDLKKSHIGPKQYHILNQTVAPFNSSSIRPLLKQVQK